MGARMARCPDLREDSLVYALPDGAEYSSSRCFRRRTHRKKPRTRRKKTTKVTKGSRIAEIDVPAETTSSVTLTTGLSKPPPIVVITGRDVAFTAWTPPAR